MAVSDLITSIRYQLHDTDANNWTGAEILDYINRGYKLIWQQLIRIKSDLVAKVYAETTVIGTDTYLLPTDFWSMKFIKVDGEDKPLSAVDYSTIVTTSNTFDQYGDPILDSDNAYVLTQDTVGDGTPTTYALIEGQYVLRPNPSEIRNIILVYFYKVNTLDSTSLEPFNGMINEPLIAFATGMCLNRDERTQGRQDKIVSQLISSALMLTGRRDKTLKRINAYRWEYEELV
jgi:hypothetical protein